MESSQETSYIANNEVVVFSLPSIELSSDASKEFRLWVWEKNSQCWRIQMPVETINLWEKGYRKWTKRRPLEEFADEYDLKMQIFENHIPYVKRSLNGLAPYSY